MTVGITVNTRQNTPPHEDVDECQYNRRADTVIVHTESDKYGTNQTSQNQEVVHK